MAIVTGDRYLDALFKFVEAHSSALLDGTLVLKLNPVGLHYVHSRLEQLQELESLLAGAPVDYLRAYISDLGDHRALEQLRRILRLLTSLKVVSVLPPPARDPTPVYLLPFGRLKVLELRGCDLSTSAARGLLELRHTLEKLICHNSTDALRHVFASRIVDIKDSPAWNKLSFVSCACNELVLMDESLQLLPSVETLDLSRNRFAKVDNLRRCTKLKHLDLGFNHLRTVASLTEVSCQIVKLVLRNNALTTLHGIENLKSVEGLDLSYNVISNFSELELLGSLSSLKNLWLEGNPVCCALWYRAQVFSYFTHPEELTLDERGISTRETWKRQIILASRQKQPAGYGFYSPAKDESEEGSFNTRRRKLCRLAFIEEEEQKSFFGSETFDQESLSCDSSFLRRDENPVSDGEAEVVDLMTKIEFMKKERSGLWLREFRDWVDHNSEDRVDDSKFTGVSPVKENCWKSSSGHKHRGESSRYVPDSVQDSGDESSTNFLESDVSFTDTSIGFNSHHYFDSSGKATLESSMMDGNREAIPALRLARMDSEQKQLNLLPFANMLTAEGADRIERKFSVTSLTVIDEILESRSSSIHHGSPPHYQEDILHRRHNLEEEILQLSAESFSLASSDSDTSCDDDSCKFCAAIPGADQPRSRDSTNSSINDGHDVIPFCEGDNDIEEPGARKNSRSMLYYCSGPSSTAEVLKSDITKPFCMASALDNAGGDTLDNIPSQCMDCMEKRKGKKKPSRRIISLPEGNLMRCNAELLSQKLNGVLESREVGANNRLVQPIFDGNGVHNSLDIDKEQTSALEINSVGNSHSKTRCGSPNFEMDEFIKNYFDENVAEAGVSETCLQHMLGDCILHQASGHAEMREVAILRSSEHKLYIVLLDGSLDGTGNISRVVGCHRLEDISEVVVGIGLQILRVHITGNTPYLFITRTIDKSRRLLSLLQVCDSSETSNRCSIRRFRLNYLRIIFVEV